VVYKISVVYRRNFGNWLYHLTFFLGGLIFIPQKHREATRVKYNSITTNVYPDFGHQHDNDAIRKRLEVFQTKSLNKKDGSVSCK